MWIGLVRPLSSANRMSHVLQILCNKLIVAPPHPHECLWKFRHRSSSQFRATARQRKRTCDISTSSRGDFDFNIGNTRANCVLSLQSVLWNANKTWPGVERDGAEEGHLHVSRHLLSAARAWREDARGHLKKSRQCVSRVAEQRHQRYVRKYTGCRIRYFHSGWTSS